MENEEGTESVAMKKEEIYVFHAEFCKTFANPKRIEILDLLREGEMTVTDIQRKIGETKAYTSVLLSVMRMKNIVKARKDGTNVYYSIADKKVIHAYSLMQEALAQLMEGIAMSHSLKERRRLP
jgi:ArsR family transcriptional regulator